MVLTCVPSRCPRGRRRPLRFLSPVAVGLTAWSPCLAQSRPALTVHVVDSDGHPIEAALVDLDGGGQHAEVATDAGGEALLDIGSAGDPGELKIAVSAVGYETGTRTIGRAESAVTVSLGSVAAAVDEITVSYKRSRPFSPKTLDVLDIVTDSRSRADPVLAANDLPSSTNVTGNSKLSFRASRDTISRAYFETIPLYQVRTGASVSDNTTGRSILSLAAVKDVETYPTDPPAYLAGATGGALRITAPFLNGSAGSVSLDSGHAGVVRSLGGDDAPVAKLFADVVDLSLSRVLNPSLSEIADHVRSVDAGAVLRRRIGRGDVLNLSEINVEDASFPVVHLGDDFAYTVRSSRWQSAWQANQTVGSSLVTYSVSYTGHAADEAAGAWRSRARSGFLFGSLAWSTRALDGRSSVDAGVDHQTINQRSDNNSGPNGSIFEPDSATRRQRSVVHETTAFVFATVRIDPRLTLSAGGRKILSSSLDSSIGGQLSLSAATLDGRQKLIVSIGRYEGLEVPTEAYYGPIERSTSKQVEANYTISLSRATLGAGIYSTWEAAGGYAYDPSRADGFTLSEEVTSLARVTRTRGAEFYFTATIAERLRAGGSFTISDQQLRLGSFEAAGANDYPYVVRGFLKYLGPGLSVDLSATARASSVYTAVAPSDAIGSAPALAYGRTNGDRLPEYLSADIGFVRPLAARGFTGPIAYFSVNNLTDHDNPTSIIPSTAGAEPRYRLFPGRRFNLGLVIPF